MTFQKARSRLLQYLDWEIEDKRVVKAIGSVPREKFVRQEDFDYAYDDRPLSIGHGQTISQPYIVALMLQALSLNKNDKVLDVGTGNGYVAALLARIAKEVVTVERIPELAENARILLERLGYDNVTVQCAKELPGWFDNAPYDAIIVSAAAPSVPRSLLAQLAWGGRMVIPIGSRTEQMLVKIVRENDGVHEEKLGACYFVPLIGTEAWNG
jgi:protein-L-isoaspartate(D-aspartate) O-methyltransferase